VHGVEEGEQRRTKRGHGVEEGMGILQAVVDGNENNMVEASGFFKGYTWDMARNNTGTSM